MINQLKFYRNIKSRLEETGDTFSENYMYVKSAAEKLELEIGDWTETIDYSDEDNYCVLPTDIAEAAGANDMQTVLNWLGPPPVDKQRLNARNADYFDATLVIAAAMGNNSDLLSILLQLGADVDPSDADGETPLTRCYMPQYYAQARLLLEWGAEISKDATQSKDEFIEKVLKNGSSNLVNLLKSEFGGRRCEIINLPNHPDLIGKTCVVEKYLPEKGRYKVIFEKSKVVGLVGPQNLKRRDRTPDDCGYYITFKHGWTARHEFTSRVECQVFVASLTNGDAEAEARVEQVEAEARAEEAAEALLAELSIESSADSDRKSKGGKKKGEKKGRK